MKWSQVQHVSYGLKTISVLMVKHSFLKFRDHILEDLFKFKTFKFDKDTNKEVSNVPKKPDICTEILV